MTAGDSTRVRRPHTEATRRNLFREFAPPKNTVLAGLREATLQSGQNHGWRWRPTCYWIDLVPKTKPARCEDCYFKQNMLCALNLGKPCTTFRPAERGLAPERQLAFVFRTERTTAAYAFPQPNA
jgi:hypothetical protein